MILPVVCLPLIGCAESAMRSGKPYIFWDTCVFIAWLNDETIWPSDVLRGIKDVADLVNSNEAHLVVSSLMRTEIFLGQLKLENKQKFSDFLRRSNVHEISPDMRITDRASSIREYYNIRGNKIKVPDAIMLATSILYRVDEMHTIDGLDPMGIKHTRLLALNGNVAGYALVVVPPYPRGITVAPPLARAEQQPPQESFQFETQPIATWEDVLQCVTLNREEWCDNRESNPDGLP